VIWLPDNWRALYIKYANVYQPILEYGLAAAPDEAKGLAKIFRKYGIERSARILDVSCGIGRHSIQLAKLGYEVVGFDLSPYFLKTARKMAKKEHLDSGRLRFYEGDTKFLEKILKRNEDPFDAIISMDGGLLRPTRREEHELLRSMHRFGNINCILAVDMYSRENVERNSWFYSNTFVQFFPKRLERHVTLNFDPRTNVARSHWRFYRELSGERLKHLLSIDLTSKFYSEKDLKSILRKASWNPIKAYSGFAKLRPFSSDSLNLSIIARWM
jgi:ubiquinone/menaquinone biosynthesis C-methylase UbiE